MKITSVDQLKEIASKKAIRVVAAIDANLIEYSVFYRQVARSKKVGRWQVQNMNNKPKNGQPVHAETYNDKQLKRYTHIIDAIEQESLFTVEKEPRYTLTTQGD